MSVSNDRHLFTVRGTGTQAVRMHLASVFRRALCRREAPLEATVCSRLGKPWAFGLEVFRKEAGADSYSDGLGPGEGLGGVFRGDRARRAAYFGGVAAEDVELIEAVGSVFELRYL